MQISRQQAKKHRHLTRDQDIFQHNFKLNFSQSDTHSTVIGGTISIFLKICYIGYMIYLFKKMVIYDEDETYDYEFSYTDSELARNISIKDMGIY